MPFALKVPYKQKTKEPGAQALCLPSRVSFLVFKWHDRAKEAKADHLWVSLCFFCALSCSFVHVSLVLACLQGLCSSSSSHLWLVDSLAFIVCGVSMSSGSLFF